ncbi:MAG: hypothetical protein AABW85_04465 [archaeon]
MPGFFGKMLLRQNTEKDQEKIYNLCDGSHTVEEIARKISRPEEYAENVLKQMHKDGLIVPVKIWNRTVFLTDR